MRASYRSSFGKFRPVIKHDDGREETLRAGRVFTGKKGSNVIQDGISFDTPEDAMAFAAQRINTLKTNLDERVAMEARRRRHMAAYMAVFAAE